MTKPSPNAELSILYRNINKSYFSYYSNAFTESSKVNDEEAMYIGIKISPASHWILWEYADFFRHKWIKYTTASPSNGTEFLLQAAINHLKKHIIPCDFFRKTKNSELSPESESTMSSN